MNIAVFPPTAEQIRALERRQNFQTKIAAAADALTQKRQAAAALQAECLSAEPDPPAPCPECIALRATLAKMKPPASPIEARAYPSIAEIQTVVGRYYGVTRDDICSQRRQKEVVLPRHVAMYLSKELTPFTLPMIGRHFMGRDHTTALSAIRKITRLIKTDDGLRAAVEKLQQHLGGPLD